MQRSKHSKFDRFKQSYGYMYLYVYLSQSKILWFQCHSSNTIFFNGFHSWVMQENLMFSICYWRNIFITISISATTMHKFVYLQSRKGWLNPWRILMKPQCYTWLPILNCEENRYSNMLNSLKIRKRKH